MYIKLHVDYTAWTENLLGECFSSLILNNHFLRSATVGARYGICKLDTLGSMPQNRLPSTQTRACLHNTTRQTLPYGLYARKQHVQRAALHID